MARGKVPPAWVGKRIVGLIVQEPGLSVEAIHEKLAALPGMNDNLPSVRWVYALKQKVKPRLDAVGKWYEEPWHIGSFRSQPPTEASLLEGEPLRFVSEAIPDTLAVAVFCMAGGTFLTNRQALWLGHIRYLAPPAKPQVKRLRWLRVWSSVYALEDRVAYALAEVLDTRALDTKVGLGITWDGRPRRSEATAADITYVTAVILGDITEPEPVSLRDAVGMDPSAWLNDLSIERLGDIELNDALIFLNQGASDLTVEQRQLAMLVVRWLVGNEPQWRSYWAKFKQKNEYLPIPDSEEWKAMMAGARATEATQRNLIRPLLDLIKAGDMQGLLRILEQVQPVETSKTEETRNGQESAERRKRLPKGWRQPVGSERIARRRAQEAVLRPQPGRSHQEA